jgi:poly(hydroxyalkanoate) granule-associated protein
MKYLTEMEETARQLPHDVVEAGHKVWLAGIGAVGMIGNTTATLFGTLVDEGKRFQKVEREALDKIVTKATGTVTDTVTDAFTFVQDNVQTATKAALNRLGMPSRRDVADLTTRVEVLTAKVELLSKKGAQHAG